MVGSRSLFAVFRQNRHFTKSAKPRAKVIDLANKDDQVLRTIIARRGVNYVVDVAAAVEAAQ